MIKIEILQNPAPQDLNEINNLLPQIAQKPHLLSMKELRQVVNHDSCNVIIARTLIGKRMTIVGMSALTLVYIPTGLITTIEDVIVDEKYRGRGIGRKLTQKMIDIAKKKKAKHISLTTNPAREAANAMYQKMGFFRKDTNYYRINLFLPEPTKLSKKN